MILLSPLVLALKPRLTHSGVIRQLVNIVVSARNPICFKWLMALVWSVASSFGHQLCPSALTSMGLLSLELAVSCPTAARHPNARRRSTGIPMRLSTWHLKNAGYLNPKVRGERRMANLWLPTLSFANRRSTSLARQRQYGSAEISKDHLI